MDDPILERLLVDGNISWTAEEIRTRMSKAGYLIVQREAPPDVEAESWCEGWAKDLWAHFVEIALKSNQ